MSKDLEQLTQKIIKAVPSIAELKDGCKIKAGNDVYIYIKNKYDILTDGYNEDNLSDIDEGCGCCSDHKTWNKKLKPFQGLEILGRPILLEDVLIALDDNKILKISSNKKTVDILTRNCFAGGFIEHKEVSWLLNTPLHLQSEETISEINKLIK